jgi:hypothetical protein
MYRKVITYDRKTGDFALYLNGDLVGYAATYLQAESTLNRLVYELLSRPPGHLCRRPVLRPLNRRSTTRRRRSPSVSVLFSLARDAPSFRRGAMTRPSGGVHAPRDWYFRRSCPWHVCAVL